MNRIYQGGVRNTELLPLRLDRGEGRAEVSISNATTPLPAPDNWDGLDALWQHHALFQDAVNYYLVCLLALAGPKNKGVWEIRQRLNATVTDEDGNLQDDELMVYRRMLEVQARQLWRYTRGEAAAFHGFTTR